MSRTILHVDMDAFFVAVELRRRPGAARAAGRRGGHRSAWGGGGGVLRGAPLRGALGDAEARRRAGCVRRRCSCRVITPRTPPSDAEVHAHFQAVTPLVEPLALDEAFLDVTGARALLGDGATIATRLRAAISDDLDLTCSVGVATNKFIAKLASVDAKPRATPDGIRPGPGVFEVPPGGELTYLHALAVRRLWGAGRRRWLACSGWGSTPSATSPPSIHRP